MISLFTKEGRNIRAQNHLVARLFERTQASETIKANRRSCYYALQCNHDFYLFKVLAVLGKQPALLQDTMEEENGDSK